MEAKEKATKFDLIWALNLFGTAVGAGVLFLPINAGMAGFWPLIVMVAIVGPMTFYSHKALSMFVLSSKNAGEDITQVISEHFGKSAGFFMGLLYFFAIWPLIMIYGNAITNTAESFAINQMGFESFNRTIVSFVLIALFISVMLMNEKVMLKLTEYLVYPLILVLLGISIYLIPNWKMDMVREVPSFKDLLKTFWLTIPALVFSFNHSPAISGFSLSMQKQYKDRELTEKHAVISLKNAASILVIFVMFFVFSCVLTLSPEQLEEAKTQNISILSYFANEFGVPWFSYVAPCVAFLSITSSFFGHYLGAREGLEGIVARVAGREVVEKKEMKYISALFFLFTLWPVAIWNPNILSVIESLGGPIIAMMLFIMPMYAIKKVPAMAKYKGHWSNVFVTVMGIIAISAVLYLLKDIF